MSQKNRPRNPYVAPAKQRSGAGAMHDRRALKGGARNQQREDFEEWEEEPKTDDDSSTTDVALKNKRG